MQTTSSRIQTWAAVFIPYDSNPYTIGTSYIYLIVNSLWDALFFFLRISQKITLYFIRSRVSFGVFVSVFVLQCSLNSLSPSSTHLSHTTNITLSRIKCERLYSYKEACSFIHWSRHYCWLCFRLYLDYVYVSGYTTQWPEKKEVKTQVQSQVASYCYILTLNRAVNQEMHLCK